MKLFGRGGNGNDIVRLAEGDLGCNHTILLNAVTDQQELRRICMLRIGGTADRYPTQKLSFVNIIVVV